MALYSSRYAVSGSRVDAQGRFHPYMPMKANYHDSRSGLSSIFSGAEKFHEQEVYQRHYSSVPNDQSPGLDHIILADANGNAQANRRITIGGRDVVSDTAGRVKILQGHYWNQLAAAEEERRAYCRKIARWVLVDDSIAIKNLGIEGFLACIDKFPEKKIEGFTDIPDLSELQKQMTKLGLDSGESWKFAEEARQIWADLPTAVQPIDCRPSATNGIAPTTLKYQEKVSKLLEIIKRRPLAVIDEQPSTGEAPAVIHPAQEIAKSLGGNGGDLKSAVK